MIRERVNFSGQNFASFLNPAESFRREFRIFNFSFLESTCLLFIFLDKFDLSKSCELRMISLKNECKILRRLSQTVILLHKGSYFSGTPNSYPRNSESKFLISGYIKNPEFRVVPALPVLRSGF